MKNNNVIRLGEVAAKVREESDTFAQAKWAKAGAENDVLAAVLEAVLPALPAICSKMEGLAGPVKRAVNLGGDFYLGEQGDFFRLGNRSALQVLDLEQVLDALPLPAIVAVLGAALENQVGRRVEGTLKVEREARTLRAISEAFKVGGIR